MCAADEDVCGLGRVCTDWAPPTDPSTVNAPATTCSACLPGYTPSPAFTLTLEDYELAISVGGTLPACHFTIHVTLPACQILPVS